LALQLNLAGDSFGRFTPLNAYNYEVLFGWFSLLDKLDNRSHILPTLASYYYSNTKDKQNLKRIITYLELTYDSDPQNKWWWLGQAVMLAKFKLNDNALAFALAQKLSENKAAATLPRWAQQLPAILQANVNENEAARQILLETVRRYNTLEDGDINYMLHFFKNTIRQ
jgi:hypothetical protein